mmetsp:Transcript_35792/g.84486  ORF Transcript_35792/g.84486 Transcript_35792/m.84486 type:complete len:202 (-) Transcript_35792:1402-2007(-)
MGIGGGRSNDARYVARGRHVQDAPRHLDHLQRRHHGPVPLEHRHLLLHPHRRQGGGHVAPRLRVLRLAGHRLVHAVAGAGLVPRGLRPSLPAVVRGRGLRPQGRAHRHRLEWLNERRAHRYGNLRSQEGDRHAHRHRLRLCRRLLELRCRLLRCGIRGRRRCTRARHRRQPGGHPDVDQRRARHGHDELQRSLRQGLGHLP